MNKVAMCIGALGLLGAFGVQAAASADLLGDLTSATEASRTIAIGPGTRYVNVTQGEVVRFVANGQEFAFNFDGAADVSSFDLLRVAPAGVLDHSVIAYVSPLSNGGRGGHGGRR